MFPRASLGVGAKKEVANVSLRITDSETWSHTVPGFHLAIPSPEHPSPTGEWGGRRRELPSLADLSALVDQDHVAEHRRVAWGRTPAFLRAGRPPSQHELHRRLRAFGENTE